jgi:hypothetical protein
MRLKCAVAGTGLLLASLGLGTFALAQADPTSGDESSESQKKTAFALYVEVGLGTMTADDIGTSIRTSTGRLTNTQISLEDQVFSRVALGWKLPYDKGSFRFRFDGYKEDGYALHSTGSLNELDPDLGVSNAVSGALKWWTVDVVDGQVHAERTPPIWDPLLDDADGDLLVDPEEVRYGPPDRILSSGIADDLQNRAQTYDLLYGREFGSRRIGAQWWGGLRYFAYEGNLFSTAWLMSSSETGFTDNALLPLLAFSQETSGFGPTGIMEVNYKFFDERLRCYVRAQAAFLLADLKVDSGEFSTLVFSDAGPIVPIRARLTETRNKSTWNTALELGARYQMRNGVSIEAAVTRVGFLDAILLPDRIQIPVAPQEGGQGTSALYSTQDYNFDGYRLGVSFQF